MLLAIANDAPKITDWITAMAAAVGIPLSFYAFMKLVMRDRQRESQIASLANISKQLTEQVQELSSQTQESKYQSEMMFEHNKLFEQQLELQTKAQIEHKSFEIEKLALEKQKRRMEIRPYFTFRQGSSSVNGNYIQLLNKGERATDIIAHESTGIAVNLKTAKPELDKNGLLDLYGTTSSNNPQTLHQFSITYKDQDGNEYAQIIGFRNNSFEVSKPTPVD